MTFIPKTRIDLPIGAGNHIFRSAFWHATATEKVRIDSAIIETAMEDNDLFLAMLGVAIAAVMLVAVGLFIITRQDAAQPATQMPVPAVTSSLEGVRPGYPAFRL